MPNWPLKLTTTDPAWKVRWRVMEEDPQSRALGFVCACAGKHTLHTLSSLHTQEPTCYHHSLGAKGFNMCVLEGTDATLALPFWNSVSSENGEMTPQVFSILCAVCRKLLSWMQLLRVSSFCPDFFTNFRQQGTTWGNGPALLTTELLQFLLREKVFGQRWGQGVKGLVN